MNLQGREIKLFAGNSNPKMAQDISEYLGIPLSKCEVGKFSDGETSVSVYETVRGSDCFIIQSTSEPTNDNLMELLILIDALKRAAYGRLDGQHTEYLLRCEPEADPLLSIGLNYLRFAVEKPLLFRFLFQSGYAAESSVSEMIDSEEMRPVLAAMQEGLGMDAERTRDVFVTLGLFTHGYASILANHTMTFDENLAAARLERAFNGAVAAVLQEETK